MIAGAETSTYDYHPIMSDTSPTRLPPLTCQRDAFSLPPDVCYLNSAYMGPLPQAVRLATERALSARTVPVDLTSGGLRRRPRRRGVPAPRWSAPIRSARR